VPAHLLPFTEDTLARSARVPDHRAARSLASSGRGCAAALAITLLMAGCGASPVEEAVLSARPYVVDEVELKG
jgi:hypothetical protein